MVYKFRDEKGIALIAAIGISLMLMLVAIAVAYRVGLFTQRSAILEKKDQLTFTADYGLETLRYYLWNRDCPPPTWCGAVSQENPNTYINFIRQVQTDQSITQTLKFDGMFSSQTVTVTDGTKTILTITHSIDGNSFRGNIDFDWTDPDKQDLTYQYSIYTRQSSTPDILYTMVSATRIQGTEAGQEQVLERTTVEAAFYFSIPCPEDYKQFGQCKGKEGSSAESGITASIQQL